MQKPPRNGLKRRKPAWVDRLAKIAGDFPIRETYVVGVGVDVRAKALEVELNNGYTLVMQADGASRVMPNREPAPDP